MPTTRAFDPIIHLSWGDVANSVDQPKVLRIFLKWSKMDQLEEAWLSTSGRQEATFALSRQ